MLSRDLPPSLLEASAPAVSPAPAEQLYAVLSATNEAILRAGSTDELYQRVCDAATGSGLIMIAAVLVPDEADFLRVAAGSGPTQLPSLRISVDASKPEGRGLAGTAFQTRAPCVSADVLADPRTTPWRAAQAATGVRSGAAVPLVRNGASAAVLLFYSPLPGAFDAATVRLLERLVDNVCYALEGFEREAERTRLSEALQRFRAAIDLSGDTVYLTDVETMRFIDVNETACRRLGYTRAELLTMGPAHLTNKSVDEIRALYDRVIACAPDAIVTEQIGAGRDGRTWFSEVSRRALKSGERWLIVTISRDINERRRHEQLQALQHAVTHQLAQTGTVRAVLEAVLAGLGPALAVDRGWCVIGADPDGAAPQRLAAWQRDDAPPGFTSGDGASTSGDAACTNGDAACTSRDAAVLACALGAAHGQVMRLEDDAAPGYVVPVCADGKTLGALALQGAALPPLAQIDHVLVAIGDQLGQFIRRKQAEAVLARSEARFRSLTELSSDWYWECDTEHRFVSFDGRNVGDAGQRDWRSDFFGKAIWELPHLVHESADWPAHRALLERRERFIDFQFAVRTAGGALRWTNASGEPVLDADGGFVGYHGVSRDITERRLAEDSIRHLATHDTLTGLPNRALFVEELGRSMRDARRDGHQLALLFVDLDHFKIINDTLGHDAGDVLLAQMARALRNCLRPNDLVARLGGDEFVVLLRHAAGKHEAAVVARKLLSAVTQPLSLKGQECRVSASVGICIFPDNALDEAALMKGADIAMYEAKREGRNGFRYFSPDAPTQSPLRLRMASNLRVAIERDEFTLHFQPKVDLTTGRITGAEALLRWTNAELGTVPPGEFIPLAEESGLMLPIGRWVLHQACEQHMAWRRQGLPAIPLAVNLSPRQFADADLLGDIQRALQDTGMPPGALELEVTEGVVISNPERALATLQAIKRMGVRLAIDDFGTGYSSLGQLKRFPIDTLKIDRSFIRGLPADVHDSAIVEAIVVMCRALELDVVAEGVETIEQREFLRQHACTQMQGYQFSKPLPADAFAALLRHHARGAAAA
jgi:diguanylate cyclase (GGDEF)-like protein/PAS domain S-box-containing protein